MVIGLCRLTKIRLPGLQRGSRVLLNRLTGSLELKLHRQLQLPRRTKISGWVPGPARNEAIGGRSGGHCQTGIEKICLIKHVECTELELEVQALRDAGILDERNIEV